MTESIKDIPTQVILPGMLTQQTGIVFTKGMEYNKAKVAYEAHQKQMKIEFARLKININTASKINLADTKLTAMALVTDDWQKQVDKNTALHKLFEDSETAKECAMLKWQAYRSIISAQKNEMDVVRSQT